MTMKHAALALLAGSLLIGPSGLAIAEDEHHSGTAPSQQGAPPAAVPRPQGPGPGIGGPGAVPMPGQPAMGPQGMEPRGRQGAMPMGAMGMSGMDEFTQAFPGTEMMQRVEGGVAVRQ